MSDIVVQTPNECAEQLEALIALAAKGEEVDPEHLHSGIPDRSRYLLWKDGPNGICAVGALKEPRISYRERVFRQSQSGLRCEDYPLELGYIYVEEVLRGQHIASNLVERAMREAGNVGVFATTRTDNAAMQKILCRNGFVLAGNPYLSNDGQRNLSLFVHPAGAS